MAGIPIPKGATIGDAPQGVPIPAGATVGDTSPAPQAQPEPPSLGQRVLRGLTDAFGTTDFQPSDFITGPKQLITHPLDTLNMIGQAADEGQRAEYEKMYKNPSVGGKVARYIYGTVPIIGPALGNAADKFERGDYAGGTTQSLGIAGQVFGGTPEGQAAGVKALNAGGRAVETVRNFPKAESNPNTLYHSYLDPVADQAFPLPKTSKAVLNAVAKDIEDAGNEAAAARIRSGQATLNDGDLARMSANRLGSATYDTNGKYSTGLAKGAQQFADDLRESMYPVIEKAHGLPAGSLGGIKAIQGASMAAQRGTLGGKIITGIGAGAGAGIGYELGGWPGSIAGGAIGGAAAEPVASAVSRGTTGLRTKALASRLPKAQPISGDAALRAAFARSAASPEQSPAAKQAYVDYVRQRYDK